MSEAADQAPERQAEVQSEHGEVEEPHAVNADPRALEDLYLIEREALKDTSRGWRWTLNLLLLAALALLVQSILGQAVQVSERRAAQRLFVEEGRRLYEAFDRFYRINGRFPNEYADPAFEPQTLEPLRRRGYYNGHVTALLADARADGYEAPDDQGTNGEFWLELTLADDPATRLLIARSDDAPMCGGEWCDGVFLWTEGRLERH